MCSRKSYVNFLCRAYGKNISVHVLFFSERNEDQAAIGNKPLSKYELESNMLSYWQQEEIGCKMHVELSLNCCTKSDAFACPLES